MDKKKRQALNQNCARSKMHKKTMQKDGATSAAHILSVLYLQNGRIISAA
jgi:hypothetical protein